MLFAVTLHQGKASYCGLTSCTNNAADKTDSTDSTVTKTVYLKATILKIVERFEARISENKYGGPPIARTSDMIRSPTRHIC